jgi:hypothetical protein
MQHAKHIVLVITALSITSFSMAQQAAPLDVNREGSYLPSDGLGSVNIKSLFGKWEEPLTKRGNASLPGVGEAPSSLVFSAHEEIVDGRKKSVKYYQFNENEIGIISHGTVRRSCLFLSLDEIVCKAPADKSYIRYDRMKPEGCKPETKDEELARTTWVDGDPNAFSLKPPRCTVQ